METNFKPVEITEFRVKRLVFSFKDCKNLKKFDTAEKECQKEVAKFVNNFIHGNNL